MYLDAIPFFPMEIVSNFVFSFVFFGLHNILFTNRQATKANVLDLENNQTDNLLVNSNSNSIVRE